MSSSVEIFVARPATVASVRAVIEATLGVCMEFRAGDGEPHYWAADPRVGVTVGEGHPFVPDFGMDFPRYAIIVDMWGHGQATRDDEEGAAHELFDALRADGRFPLLMSRDLQERLDTFEPEHHVIAPDGEVWIDEIVNGVAAEIRARFPDCDADRWFVDGQWGLHVFFDQARRHVRGVLEADGTWRWTDDDGRPIPDPRSC